MSDNIYSLMPINGTAARVTSQGGCSTELTPKQKRDNLVDRANQVEAELLILPKKSKERKALGLIKMNICLEISALNTEMKKVRIDHTNRGEFTDCVFDVMREQLSPFKYKHIMKLARGLYKYKLESKEV